MRRSFGAAPDGDGDGDASDGPPRSRAPPTPTTSARRSAAAAAAGSRRRSSTSFRPMPTTPLLMVLLLLLGAAVVPRPAEASVLGDLGSGISDWLGLNDGTSSSSSSSFGTAVPDSTATTLTLMEISDMRVRDIKWRLARTHGYGADELARMLDKKELINALSYEEHKVRQEETERRNRFLLRRGIMVALAVVVATTFWPLVSHAAEVAHVNFVVYTDKKRYEAGRCWELKSARGFLGVFLMFVVDGLSFWLSASVLLSWVMRSKYFFPVPHIPIRPAAMLAASTGGSAGPLGKYGLNVGPMVVTWAFRFLNGRVETWTGRALSKAHRAAQRKAREARKDEAPWEKAARKAAKKARKAEKEERKRRTQEEERRRHEAWEEMQREARTGGEGGGGGGGPAGGGPPHQAPGGCCGGGPSEPKVPSEEAMRRAAAAADEFATNGEGGEGPDDGWDNDDDDVRGPNTGDRSREGSAAAKDDDATGTGSGTNFDDID